jgi:hypothetical protein
VVTYRKIIKERKIDETFARLYWHCDTVPSNADAYSLLTAGYPLDRLVIEKSERLPRISAIPEPSGNVSGRVILKYSSYNRLIFSATTSAPGFFALSYPYSKNWHATVKGRDVPIYRANGIQQAVAIPAGENCVEFRYWSPATFWGMCISCLAALGVLLFGCTALRPVPLRLGSMVIVSCVVIYLWYAWYHGLYTGRHLGTRSLWEVSVPARGSGAPV